MPLAFDHRSLAQRVIFRPDGAASAVADALHDLGAARPLLIAGSTGTELAGSIATAFPHAAIERDVVQHVPAERAAAARDRLRGTETDVLVSIGGGSATGLAKALARDTGLPIVAVPTTFSGSEATNVWGRTERGRKSTGVDDRVLPRVVVYDVALFRGLDRSLAMTSGLNALAHAVDALWAPRADPINAATGEDGMRALVPALRALARLTGSPAGDEPTADGGSLDEALEQLLLGAYLAAVAFASAGSGLHHKICHVLGGSFGLPHAETHAVVLPYAAAVNLRNAPAARARLAGLFPRTTPAEGLFALQRELGAPSSLRALGLDRGDVERAARLSFEAMPASNPGSLQPADLERLLAAAWAGDPAAVAIRTS